MERAGGEGTVVLVLSGQSRSRLRADGPLVEMGPALQPCPGMGDGLRRACWTSGLPRSGLVCYYCCQQQASSQQAQSRVLPPPASSGTGARFVGARSLSGLSVWLACLSRWTSQAAADEAEQGIGLDLKCGNARLWRCPGHHQPAQIVSCYC
jgi:hypothetical protein